MRIVYIDDDKTEIDQYTKMFKEPQVKDKFEIIPINAQREFEELIKEVKTKNPQLILLDFKLEKPNDSGDVIGISGAPLSTAFKEIFPEVPVVFFTKLGHFSEKENSQKIYTNVDATIIKNDIYNDSNAVFDFLYKLAEGFEKLRSNQNEWIGILEAINASENDYDILKLSRPPSLSLNSWSISGTADWIINTIIKYPGILYNSIHSATILGISESEFESEPMKNFFSKAKYSGVFEPLEGRWWKSQLQELAESIMNADEKSLLIRKGFPLAWERINKTKIERSKCIYSGELPAEWVCYILKEPMMIKYSLSYRPDSRPSVMDEARISFKAIETTNEVNDEFFDPLELEIYNEIRDKNGG